VTPTIEQSFGSGVVTRKGREEGGKYRREEGEG
jgi:hypothetical protein